MGTNWCEEKRCIHLFLYKSVHTSLSIVIHLLYFEISYIYITPIYNLKVMSCIFDLYRESETYIFVFTDRTEIHYNSEVPLKFSLLDLCNSACTINKYKIYLCYQSGFFRNTQNIQNNTKLQSPKKDQLFRQRDIVVRLANLSQIIPMSFHFKTFLLLALSYNTNKTERTILCVTRKIYKRRRLTTFTIWNLFSTYLEKHMFLGRT